MEKGPELLQAAHAGDCNELNQLLDEGVDVAYQVCICLEKGVGVFAAIRCDDFAMYAYPSRPS